MDLSGDAVVADDGPPDLEDHLPGNAFAEVDDGSALADLQTEIVCPYDEPGRLDQPEQLELERIVVTRTMGDDLVRPVLEVAPSQVVADAVTDLDLTAEWHRLVDRRMSQVEELVERVRALPAVRVTADLADELRELHPTDPEACLRTVSCVLAEALALQRAPAGADTFDEWLTTLVALADDVERLRPTAVVAPDARGEIDGHMPAGPVSDVQVRDSVGVLWGAHNRLRVEHRCVVESPIIEVAELIDMDGADPVWNWTAWQRSSPQPARESADVTLEAASTLHQDHWVNLWNCRGVTIGDRNSLDLTYVYRMTSCQVNLVPLLSNAAVREELARCRDGSPENAEQAREARHRLPSTVANAVRAIDLSKLVREEEIAALAARTRQPSVRGGSASLVVTHGVGVAIGTDPSVSWRRRTRVGRPRVR
ncbi:hypothetical protein AB0C15_02390 [Micromonospora sp. NPDC048835]|uniref:hypothetical protein n=1 Tax=Micromonospora sp. NPDC048835 TaxID=3155147 RepID=UPI0033FBE3D1